MTENKTNNSNWTLDECNVDGARPRRIVVDRSPFRIGRIPDSSHAIDSSSISKQHALLTIEQGTLFVEDLGSTNGTFVNGKRLRNRMRLKPGDLVQFANFVFQVSRAPSARRGEPEEASDRVWTETLERFDQLMTEQAILPFYQPVVRLPSCEVIGYELLARSAVEGLENATVMFDVAGRLGQECMLSEMLRREGVRLACNNGAVRNIFVNTLPQEILSDDLIRSLQELRRLAPAQEITIEVDERSITRISDMIELRGILSELDMKLAYDDFGAGETRLQVLSEAPPDFVKFDGSLIRGIDRADGPRKKLLEWLVATVRDMRVVAVAEGIETEGEARTCLDFGFHVAQGYYFGQPVPLAEIQQSEVAAS